MSTPMIEQLPLVERQVRRVYLSAKRFSKVCGFDVEKFQTMDPEVVKAQRTLAERELVRIRPSHEDEYVELHVEKFPAAKYGWAWTNYNKALCRIIDAADEVLADIDELADDDVETPYVDEEAPC